MANYPGVTVERRTGLFNVRGQNIEVTDTPGIYSLNALGEDEVITLEYIKVQNRDVTKLIFVLDGTNLTKGLFLLDEIRALDFDCVVLLSLTDASNRSIYDEILSRRLGLNVYRNYIDKDQLKAYLSNEENYRKIPNFLKQQGTDDSLRFKSIRSLIDEVSAIKQINLSKVQESLNFITLNRYVGGITFVAVMFSFFQSVFFLAEYPMELIENLIEKLQLFVSSYTTYPILTSFIGDGLIAGVGSFVVFLPQIMLLFFFLTLLEDSGYLSRACHVIDYPLRRVGLQGRSFIPLLSSFACAIPGIMSARSIGNRKDRLLTILVAPFMSCSARLPVYTVLIGALVPTTFYRSISLTALYFLGIVGGLIVSFALNLLFRRHKSLAEASFLALELPQFRIPSLINAYYQSIERGKVFLRDAGGIILICSLLMWFLVSFPMITDAQTQIAVTPMIKDSYAGRLGAILQPLFAPLQLSWEFSIAIIASFAAREVFVSSLSTIVSVAHESSLTDTLRSQLELGTLNGGSIVGLLVFYVFSAQCMSTLAIIKRETNSYFWPIAQFVLMTIIAYGGGYVAYLLFNTLR